MQLSVGAIALVLMLVTECAVGYGVSGRTPVESLLSHDPVSGTVYYVTLVLSALAPLGMGSPGRGGTGLFASVSPVPRSPCAHRNGPAAAGAGSPAMIRFPLLAVVTLLGVAVSVPAQNSFVKSRRDPESC